MSSVNLKHSSGNGTIINGPVANPSADITLKVPSTTGTAGQVLSVATANHSATNAELEWAAAGGSGSVNNLFYNGAMRVAQRATSTTAGADGYFACDRWRIGIGGEDESVTVAQSALTSSDTPYSSGFRYATKITNGNQSSGAGATDYLTFGQRLEGQDIHCSGWDFTSASSKLTVSFWIKSSVAQTFYSRFRVTEASATKEYVFAVAATTSWQKITKTIPGASGLNPVNTNAYGFFWDILLMYGTDYTGTMTLDQWNTVNTSAYVPDMTTTWWTTNDATFEITGCQLEIGDTGNDYAHQKYIDDLLACQRYFWKADFTTYSHLYHSTGTMLQIWHPVEMRARPTVTITGDSFSTWTSGDLTSDTKKCYRAYLSVNTSKSWITSEYNAEL